MTDFRCQIVLDFAKWTALSATRSGSPIKSRLDVYPLLDAVAFGEVLQPGSSITAAEFDAWHEAETLAICARDRRVPTGWGVKLINVYLKTAVYIGDLGRPVSARRSIRRSTPGFGRASPRSSAHGRAQTRCVLRKFSMGFAVSGASGTSPSTRRIAASLPAAGPQPTTLAAPLSEVEQLWQGSATPVVSLITEPRWDHSQGINPVKSQRDNRPTPATLLARRWFLQQCGVGLGVAALADLLGDYARAGRQPAGGEAAALPGEGEERHFPVHGGRAEPPGTVRQQAGAGEMGRQAAAGGIAQGLSHRVHQPELEAARAEVQVRPARPIGAGTLGIAAAPGDGRRRHLHRQIDGHRCVQPRPGPDFPEHRRPAVRPAEPRGLDALRPRQRIEGPARLRRLQHRQQGALRRQFQLGLRLLADHVPGRHLPHRRRTGPLSLQPARRR